MRSRGMDQSPRELNRALLIPEYARPPGPEKPGKLVRIAMACGVIPLVFGCLDFLLWIPTRDDTLELGGLLIIEGGTVVVLIGMLFLLAHLAWLDGPRRFKRFFVSSWLALLLMLIN